MTFVVSFFAAWRLGEMLPWSCRVWCCCRSVLPSALRFGGDFYTILNAMKTRPLIIGHRGAMGHEPENTILSIEKAIRLGASWVEIDVQFVDGHLVVFHDDRLDRTTDGTGLISEKTWDYLRSLDAGKGQKI